MEGLDLAIKATDELLDRSGIGEKLQHLVDRANSRSRCAMQDARAVLSLTDEGSSSTDVITSGKRPICERLSLHVLHDMRYASRHSGSCNPAKGRGCSTSADGSRSGQRASAHGGGLAHPSPFP
jgi:hypothetical protein